MLVTGHSGDDDINECNRRPICLSSAGTTINFQVYMTCEAAILEESDGPTLTIATDEDLLSLEILFRQILNRLLGLELHERRWCYISHTESVCCIEDDQIGMVRHDQTAQVGEQRHGRNGFALILANLLACEESTTGRPTAHSQLPAWHLRTGANALAWKAVAARARMTDLENFMVKPVQ